MKVSYFIKLFLAIKYIFPTPGIKQRNNKSNYFFVYFQSFFKKAFRGNFSLIYRINYYLRPFQTIFWSILSSHMTSNPQNNNSDDSEQKFGQLFCILTIGYSGYLEYLQ